MIVPSIDILGGRAVQLLGGDPARLEVDAGDPRGVAERFGVTERLAVIDLDAALGRGDNRELIAEICRNHACRVGGGLRSVEAARRMLDAGAEEVLLGTAATPEVLSQLPKDRVWAAVDARDQRVVVEGWARATEHALLDRIRELAPYVGGFLVTFVEREGRLKGTDLELARQVVEAADGCSVTIAGGITTPDEVRALHELGADAQVGMALYTGRFELGDAIWACAISDRDDGLVPTVVTDEHGTALGLVYSDHESVADAVRHRRGSYHSRSRGGLWIKGESSGHTQELLSVGLDCDSDALCFRVRQRGAFCHLNTRSCWGPDDGLSRLDRTIGERQQAAPEGSYTKRLATEQGLLDAKLREEIEELIAARNPSEVTHEAADVLYFTLVRAAQAGVSLHDVERELDLRARRITRRSGNRKDAP